MINDMHCDEFGDRLADLLEREVDETTRATLESHALECDECGALLADLRKLRIDAANLPVLTPSHDLWSGVAERIDAPVIPLRTGEFRGVRRVAAWPRWASMAAAAVLLVGLTSTSTYFFTTRARAGVATRTAINASPVVNDSLTSVASAREPASEPMPQRGSDSADTRAENRTPLAQSTRSASAHLVSNKPTAEQVYTGEIARLRLIVARRRSQLDPVTVGVIERNLRVIDDAIAQCKLALAKDPASRFLMESLNNALETKVELLRTATMLPARS
jgi:hypothetical protein